MSQDHEPNGASGAGISRRRFLAQLGLLTLVATAGSSLLTPDDADAGKKRSGKKKNHGRKVSKVARKKHSRKNHGRKVSKVARKKGRKKRG